MRLTRVQLLAISGVIVLALVTRLVCFVGLIGSDDLTYNHRAYEIISGTFEPQLNNQSARAGMFLPVAAAFKVFGIHEISSVAFPFLCGLLTLGLVLWMGITYLGGWPGIMAGLLYAFLPIDMFHATVLLPDLPSATWMTISALLFYRSDIQSSHRKAWGWLGMFLAGLALGWAYLIKETSVFMAVFLFGSIGCRWWHRKKISWGWAWLLVGVLVPVGMEFGYYAWTTGMPFYRYSAVQMARSGSSLTGRTYQGVHLVSRLTLHTFYMIFHVLDFSVIHVFALAGCIYSLWKKIPFVRFLAGWLLCMLFLYNFGSASLSAYDPLVLFHRFFLVVSFPGVLVCAWFFQEAVQVLSSQQPQDLKRLRIALFVPVLALLATNIVWFSWITTGALFFLGVILAMTFLVAFRQWLRAQNATRVRIIMPVVLLMAALLPGIILAARGERIRKGLTCEREILPLLEFPLQRVVYTDRRTEPILEFFYQYQNEDQILAFHDLDLTTVTHAYVIANWERLFFLERLYRNRIPETLYHPPSHWRGPVQIGGEVNPCLIYQVP